MFQNTHGGFPGGPEVKTPPCSKYKGHRFHPWWGRSRMPCSKQARAPQLLSSCPKACKSQLLSLHFATAEAMRPELAFHDRSSHGNERPTIHDKSSPRSPQLEKPKCNNKDRAKKKQPKNQSINLVSKKIHVNWPVDEVSWTIFSKEKK